MRSFAVMGLGTLLLLAGCAGNTSRNTPLQIFPDMDKQAKQRPQSYSSVFADGRASRVPVAGTVARGNLKEDEAFFTGVTNNQYIGKNPLPVTADLLKRGQERFNIYCSPCHDRTATGRGLVGQSSLWLATNLHEDRVRQMNDGEIFTIVSQGRRSMPAYRFQIPERDRWAIIAYVRALQRANLGTLEDVPEYLRSELR